MNLRGLAGFAAALGAVGTLGCSDPATSPPRGGAYLEVGNANPLEAGKNCPHSSLGITLGYTAPSQLSTGKPLTDEENGAHVSCSINGGKFHGQLTKDAGFFVMDGTVSNGTGTASIAVYDEKAVKTLASPSDKPCQVTVLSKSDEKIWATFTCEALTSSAPNLLCAATQGVVFLDHCD